MADGAAVVFDDSNAPTAPPPEAFPEAGSSADAAAIALAADASALPAPGTGALGVHEPYVRSLVRTTADWPRAGVNFLDISQLLAETRAFRMCVDSLAQRYGDTDGVGGVTHVAGVDARGFVFGSAVAYALNCGFVMLRKAGKLPPGDRDHGGLLLSQEYEMEYGKGQLQMAADLLDVAQETNPRVVLVDDLLATGGTAIAACNLLRVAGATVVEVAVAIELVSDNLNGRARLKEKAHIDLHTLLTF